MNLFKMCIKISIICGTAINTGCQGAEEKEYPRNIIVLLASGMSSEAVTSTRVELRKMERNVTSSSSLEILPFENLPSRGALMAYDEEFSQWDDDQSRWNIFNGPNKRNKRSCDNIAMEHPLNVFSLAQKAGKLTGLVTNLRITSEFPASIFGIDGGLQTKCLNLKNTQCIGAHQVINGEIASKMTVLFGKSHSSDKGENIKPLKYCGIDEGTFELEWKRNESNRIYIRDLVHLKNIELRKGDQVLGLFQRTPHYVLDRMISKAIKRLEDNDNGYLLTVLIKERNVIDTVKMVSALTHLFDKHLSNDTLFVVTSDHAELLRKCHIKCFPNRDMITNNESHLKKEKTTADAGTLKNKSKHIPTQMATERPIDEGHLSSTDADILTEATVVKNDGVAYVNTTDNFIIPESDPKSVSVPKTADEISSEISLPINKPKIEKTEQEVESSSFSMEISPMSTIHQINDMETTEEYSEILISESFTEQETVTETLLPSSLSVSTHTTTEEAPPVNEISETVTDLYGISASNSYDDDDYYLSATDKSNMITMADNAPPTHELVTPAGTDFSFIYATEPSLRSPIDSNKDAGYTSKSLREDPANNTDHLSSSRKKREIAEKTVIADLPVYASGPLSQLLNGVKKQALLWEIISRSICVTNSSLCIDLESHRFASEFRKFQGNYFSTSFGVKQAKMDIITYFFAVSYSVCIIL